MKSPDPKIRVKIAPGNHMYKPDKKEVFKLKVNMHEMQKQLPKVEDVQDLIINKKKIHNSVIMGINSD